MVHGFVHDISRDEVPAQDFMPGDQRSDATINVIVLEIEIRHVLKGYHVGSHFMDVVVVQGIPWLRTDYNVGNEVVLSTIYWKYMRGGSYMVMNDGGCFRKVGDTWWNQLVIAPNAPLAVAYSEIEMAAARCLPHVILGQASLAVIGTVDGISPHRKSTSTPSENARQIPARNDPRADVIMRVTDVVKGTPGGDTVTFRPVPTDDHARAAKENVPSFAVGDQWLVFLGRDATGYFAIDCTNGLFRVKGDSLIQADRVVLPATKSTFIAEMRKADAAR
ncbi:MAG TPA: hypothetical protein VEC56_01450 [Candidatus Krumholzibacteria bacterium]|nr:hypothetical protein [Candidatus Krumholzibacteria bacterium]